ncbi:MAG: sigma-70 family RNA polymerase sigma factor [Anaerolineaceae bacterium]|nr:sigma-70 family RNA polymerase sigma factor [Anaerolineaceae bacterium]
MQKKQRTQEKLRQEEAFHDLYENWLQPVYRYFYGQVGNQEDAEDLTSQVFLAACQSFGRYREQGKAAAWLFKIARNKLRDHWRKKIPSIVAFDEIHEISEGDEMGKALEAHDVLAVYLRDLTAENRELLGLRYSAKLNYQTIGNILGKSEEAIRKAHSRLLARLAERMEKDENKF